MYQDIDHLLAFLDFGVFLCFLNSYLSLYSGHPPMTISLVFQLLLKALKGNAGYCAHGQYCEKVLVNVPVFI